MKLLAWIILSCFAVPALAQEYKQLIVDPTRSFKIDHEDSIYIDGPDTLKIMADLSMPTNETPSLKAYQIRFTEARISGDTLRILIDESNAAYYHRYQIQIINSKYIISYSFLSSGEDVDRKVKADDFILILNTADLKKGREIRGHTEYKGRCVKGCWPSHSVFDIKGDFKVAIK
jgi:hypothetical protein